jgi:hypothetical protein
MFYAQSDDDQFTSDKWVDTDSLWEELSINKKMGPRIAIKRKAARYLAKKVGLRKTMLGKIIAKARKMRRSNEKRERHCSKQLLRQANLLMYG